MCAQRQINVPLAVWICRRIHIHTLHQMVSIQWGMHAEKCLCLTGIPWRLSLRCGMLFLSWDSRVLAWLPEGWCSARQIFLPSVFGCHGSQLLQAQTENEKHVPVCVSVHVCLCLFINPLSKWFMKTSCILEGSVSLQEKQHHWQRDNCFLWMFAKDMRDKNLRIFNVIGKINLT